MEAVSSGHVKIGLVDASVALGYEKIMEKKSLRIYKVLNYRSGYGVILSSDAVKLEADVRSFVTSNQAYISSFVEKKVGLLKATLIEVDEMMFTPEEAEFTLLMLTGCLAGMLVVGYTFWLLCLRKRKQVVPSGMNEYKKFSSGSSFYSNT